jgi:drug/metabolite transporter (DMT)-like permease
LTFAGVALIAAGAGGGLVSGWKGDLLAIALAVTWASYTIAIAPLMRRYSPYRISAVVLALGWAPIALVSIPQVSRQDFAFSGSVWLGFAYAVVGPLFLTNILWFTAVDRVGAARASIFNNMQPFFGVFFALLILSESLHALEIGGGILIFAGIAYERVRRRTPVPAAE